MGKPRLRDSAWLRPLPWSVAVLTEGPVSTFLSPPPHVYLATPSAPQKPLCSYSQTSATDFLLKEGPDHLRSPTLHGMLAGGPSPPPIRSPHPSPQRTLQGDRRPTVHNHYRGRNPASPRFQRTPCTGTTPPINYRVLIKPPRLSIKSNYQVLILAISMHDVLSPLGQS